MEERGAWPEAIELRAEVAADPYSNFWDDFFYARAVLYAGRHADAEPLIIELARESNKGPVWMLKADLFERTEKFEDALKAWEQAGKTGGPAYWCLFGQARALYQLRRFADAETLMAEALLLPERENAGLQFAEALKIAMAPPADAGPAGALISLAIKPDPKLQALDTETLIKELLARLRTGETVRTSEYSITFADELVQLMAEQVDVHENRFSNRRLEDHFVTFYSSLKKKPPIKDASYLDLGSGSHNPLSFGLLFVLLGARRAFAADLVPIQNERRAALALAHIADVLLTNPERIVRDFPVSPEQVRKRLEGFDLSALRAGDLRGVDNSRLRLLVAPASELPLDPGSIDVITSNSFLEHIEDPDQVIEEMARVTAPGGLGIHNIDGVDHMTYMNAKLHPLSFLCSDEAGMVNGSNRIRPMEFLKRFEKHGFSIEEFFPVTTISIDDDLRRQLTSPWREMPDEMLQVVRGMVVVKRTNKKPQAGRRARRAPKRKSS
jgi:SAM-dependent methyltransferase